MDEKLDERAQADSGPVGEPDAAGDAADSAGTPAPEAGEAEAAPESGEQPDLVRELTQEQAELKDRYLRLAADFDNFRKRSARERTETWARAQAAVVSSLLDALDDLARVAAVDAERTKAADVLGGVRLVERKILHVLENAGLIKLGSEGEAFDPNHHEAVSALPAPSTDLHDQVAAVLQPGYRFSGTLLRPAKVQVFVESDESAD